MHGSEVEKLVLHPSVWIRFFKLDAKLNKKYAASRRIFAVSDFLRKTFIQAAKIPPEHVKKIPHGIDLHLFQPFKTADERIAFRKKLGFDEKNIVFISVSRLVKEKGQDKVITSFRRLIEDYPDIRLLIVGDGEYRNQLQKMITDNRLNDKIWMVGGIPREKLWRYLASSDIFILPTRIASESFGLVYIEANACGLPVIGSKIGGVTEAVTDGVNGLLIDPDDEKDIEAAMRKMLDPDFYTEIAKKAFAEGKKHSNVEMAKHLITQ